jgi:C4-dicarboxylate-binding protein DctP
MKINALLLAFAAVVSANAQAETPIIIKFSHVVASDTPKGKAAQKFKELAEKATKGRVKVEVYPNSQLYGDKDEMEALQLGAVQMLAPSLAKFGQIGMREFEIFDLPYIFPNKDAVYRVTEGWIGQGLLKNLESKGITGLAFWDNGFKVMSANKPVRSPSDMAGLRMRIQPSKVLDVQMRTLGARPQVLGFGEVAQALKSGAVDGTENPPSNFYTQNMHEVQRHLAVTNHGYLGYAVIVNKKFWDGLPGNIRTELEAAMKEATGYANTIAQKENDAALEKVKQSGKTRVYNLSEQEKDAWHTALAPVRMQMEARIGRDLILAVSREAAGTARQATGK